MDTIKIQLEDQDIPKQWYNIAADFKTPMPPPLNPATGEPIGPEALAPLFPMALIQQEVSQERWIDIPDEVRQVLAQWRPSPLYRARRLEKVLDTPARIYYKWEGVSPSGSHKPNTAVAQAFYNREEGINTFNPSLKWNPNGVAVQDSRRISFGQAAFRRMYWPTIIKWPAQSIHNATE